MLKAHLWRPVTGSVSTWQLSTPPYGAKWRYNVSSDTSASSSRVPGEGRRVCKGVLLP